MGLLSGGEDVCLLSARRLEKEPKDIDGESKVALLAAPMVVSSPRAGVGADTVKLLVELGDRRGDGSGEVVGVCAGEEGREENPMREALLGVPVFARRAGDDTATGRGGGERDEDEGLLNAERVGIPMGEVPRGMRRVATVLCKSGFSALSEELSSTLLPDDFKSKDELDALSNRLFCKIW